MLTLGPLNAAVLDVLLRDNGSGKIKKGGHLAAQGLHS